MKLSTLALNVSAAMDNQRSGALVINLLLVQLQNNAPTLTTGDCWQLVGGKGKPSKKAPNERTYFRANSLQRTAKQVAETLKLEPTEAWHDFIELVEVIDFSAPDLQTTPAFLAVVAMMEKAGNYAVNGADVRSYIESLFEAAGSKTTTEDGEGDGTGTGTGTGEGEQQTASSNAADTVSHEAGQLAGEAEGNKDLAAAMLADLALVDSIVGKTVASLLGMDHTVALAKMAEAWQADRTRLFAEVEALQTANAKQGERLKVLSAKKPAKSDFAGKLDQAVANGEKVDALNKTIAAQSEALAEALKQIERLKANQIATAA